MKQDLSKIDTVLLDIEGTICPISFVKETLFPYAIRALPEVLQNEWNDPEFTQYRDAFPEEFRSSSEALEAHVQDLTRRDVKIAYLKNLQGYLWHTGYTTGAYTTPLFPDVLPTLTSWSKSPNPLTLAIYSSGSIQAQHLLFTYINPQSQSQSPSSTTSTSTSNSPTPTTSKPKPKPKPIDARSLITSWYDTTNAGPKTSPSSYVSIAENLRKDTGRVLFLSDSVAEVEAALQAGMKACVVVREGNKVLTEEETGRFDVVHDLGEVKVG